MLDASHKGAMNVGGANHTRVEGMLEEITPVWKE